MDWKLLTILGICVVLALLQILVIRAADKRRRRALAEAGPAQGFQPTSSDSALKIALVPLLEHQYHTWGQVLQGSRGSSEVLLFDYSYQVGKSGSNQTVVAFRDAAASFPKFQLRSNRFLTSVGWGAYSGNRVKFDSDPAFNKSYLLTGPDPRTLSSFFIPGLRNFLVSMPDHSWTVEGYGNWLVFYRHGKKVKPAGLFEFTESAGQVAETVFGLARESRPSPSSSSRGDDTIIPDGRGAFASLPTAGSLKFNFNINGHEVFGGKIGGAVGKIVGAVEGEIFRKFKEQMAAKMEGLSCPEHDQVPQLEFEGDGLSTLKIQLKTCCEPQRQKALAALGQPITEVLAK